MSDSNLVLADKPLWREPKIILAFLGMILLTGIVVVALLRDRLVNVPQWQVNVTGQGKVAYQPDTAEVTIGVQVDRVYSAELAIKQLNEKMEKIITAVKTVDISAENITTQNFSLNPQYDYRDGVQIPAGYSANQQVVVKLKDISTGNDKLTKVIAEATKAGANQILGINFSISNVEELKQQARLKAIVDAKSKAGSLAEAAGVRLGKVVGWWENIIQVPGVPGSYSYYGYGGSEKGGLGDASPTLPTGSQEIIIEVSVSYKVK